MHRCKCGQSLPVGAPFGVQCTTPSTSITRCLQGQLQVLFCMTVSIEHIPFFKLNWTPSVIPLCH